MILAEDGFAALTKITDHHPDVIFVDIMMPRLDGYQACALIKRNPKFRNTPVIMLSSKDGVFDRARGRLVGSDEYLTKPFTKDDLVKAVCAYARKPDNVVSGANHVKQEGTCRRRFHDRAPCFDGNARKERLRSVHGGRRCRGSEQSRRSQTGRYPHGRCDARDKRLSGDPYYLEERVDETHTDHHLQFEGPGYGQDLGTAWRRPRIPRQTREARPTCCRRLPLLPDVCSACTLVP